MIHQEGEKLKSWGRANEEGTLDRTFGRISQDSQEL